MQNTEMNMEKQFIERLKTSDNRKTNREAGEILMEEVWLFSILFSICSQLFLR